MLSGGSEIGLREEHPEDGGGSVRIGTNRFHGRGRIVSAKDEDALARRLLLEKYALRYSGDLSDWGRSALPVAVELQDEPGT